ELPLLVFQLGELLRDEPPHGINVSAIVFAKHLLAPLRRRKQILFLVQFLGRRLLTHQAHRFLDSLFHSGFRATGSVGIPGGRGYLRLGGGLTRTWTIGFMSTVRGRRRKGFRDRCRDLALFHLIDAQRRRDLMSHDVVTLWCQIEKERSTTGSASAVIGRDRWTAPNIRASASENDLQ